MHQDKKILLEKLLNSSFKEEIFFAIHYLTKFKVYHKLVKKSEVDFVEYFMAKFKCI